MKTIGSTLDKIIEETMQVRKKLVEKSIQPNVVDDKESVDSDDDGGSVKNNTATNLKKTADYDKYAMKTTPDVEQVIDKINILRSGHSINKNEDIHVAFERYYRNLSKAEKVALFVFLKGISEILTIDLQPSEAVDLGDAGLRIQKSQHDKPNVQSASSVKSQRSEKSKENTVAPVKVSK